MPGPILMTVRMAQAGLRRKHGRARQLVQKSLFSHRFAAGPDGLTSQRPYPTFQS